MSTLYVMGIAGNCIDDEHLHVAKWKAWYELYITSEPVTGPAWKELWDSHNLAGIGDKAIYDILSKENEGVSVAWSEAERFINRHYIDHVERVHIVPGFPDFLKTVSDSDDAIIFLSNAPRALVDAQMRLLGVEDDGQTVMVSSEDMPDGVRKPMTEAYRYALQVADEIFGDFDRRVAVDNMPKIIEGAREAGFVIALVNPTPGTGSLEGAYVYRDWADFMERKLPPRAPGERPKPPK